MANKLTVLVCKNFKRELAAVIETEEFDDVTAATFAARCGHPPLSWDALEQVICAGEDGYFCQTKTDGNQYAVLGYCCLIGLGDPPQKVPHCRLHRLDQCFYLFANQEIIDGYLKDGAYLITPGWLINWRQQIDRWGFDKTLAQEFFGESANRLLLLDTGVDPDSPEHLHQFADFVDRPFEIVPVGLDYFRLFLTKIVLEWRLENQTSASFATLQNARQQTAEYAMAMELLKSLAQTMSETKVIQNIIDIFTALFAPQELFYLPWQNGEPGQVQGVSPVDSAVVTDRLFDFDKAYGWTEAGDGFRLRFNRGDETLGILEVARIAFPEYKERYLNLALSITDVCGLAIHNARIYQQVKQAEAQIKASLAEKEVLVKEIHHRVKNNLQSLIYLIDMQTESIEDPQAIQTLQDLQGRARAMAMVHQKLYQAQNLAQIKFDEYLEDLTEHLLYVMASRQDVSLRLDTTGDLFISIDIAIPCGLIINELVTNALKYAFPDPLSPVKPSVLYRVYGEGESGGTPPIPPAPSAAPATGGAERQPEIHLTFEAHDDEYVLIVRDNGTGLPPEMDWRTAESLGLKLVNIWATYQLHGSIEVDNQEGTTFTIKFPKQFPND